MLNALTASHLCYPAARYHTPWSGAVMVLSAGQLPTTDFYIRHRLMQSGISQVQYVDISLNPAQQTIVAGTFVVIVRHADLKWIAYLKQHADVLSGVAWMMDDDLPAAWRCRDIPLDYALWTSWRYYTMARQLSQVCDRIWVSTAVLHDRYRHATVMLVPPVADVASIRPQVSEGMRWAYHGSRVHHRELTWLLPVVAAVQKQLPQACFEIFGDDKVAKRFAHIPRVTVLPYRAWPAYLAHCQQSRVSVALAPLLPGRFNQARAVVKLHDMLRCGAAGVFSDQPPYHALKLAGIAGVLENDPAVWTAHIVNLLTDAQQRQMVYQAMRQWAIAETNRQHWHTLMSPSPTQV